jgi:hypothetical protein
MKYLWIALNSTLVAVSLWDGYESLTPDRLLHKNPDAIFCLAILLTLPVFSLGIVEYSIKRWKVDRLPRPTWSRNPFNWWGDPLQSLFITTCIMGAMSIGSATQRPVFGSVGFWMLAAYCCFTIGLSVGQILVYRIYRERIGPNDMELTKQL